jgi:pyruvate,water dikinase
VRSSANVEDSLANSFAGQLTSVLSVSGLDGLVQAVIDVYESVRAPRLAPYLEGSGLSAEDLQMAVIIQEMIQPEVSGIVFSKNPITGLDEIIVEAVRGSGEALMQDGITPERWVHKWGDWTRQPAQPQISTDLIAQVIAQSKSIVNAYGGALDLEWVYDGQAIHWLQLRPITALNDVNIYSNRIAREVLPGMIKPLVWSINVPLVNGAWTDLFAELIGPHDITPEELSSAFHYRAYFNMKVIGQIMAALGMPEETLELVMGLEGGSDRPSFRPGRGTIRHIPRMIAFAARKYRYAKELETLIPNLKAAYEDFERRPISSNGEQTILEDIEELFAITQNVAYANIVTPLLMYAYNALLRGSLAKRGIDYIQLDLTTGLELMDDYDPSHHLSMLNSQFRQLEEDVQEKIRASDYEGFQALNGIESFQQEVGVFIRHFGHLSDSGNDFSSRPWRETPELLLRMIAAFGQETTEKQSTLAWDDLPLSRLDRWRLRGLYARARQYRYYREAVSFLYTYGYGLFRACFLRLGESFAERGLIDQPEDIFYLYFDEVKSLVEDGSSAAPLQEVVGKRKQEMEACQDASLPDTIYGNQAPPLESVRRSSERLVGIATSPGYYQGPVRVIRSVSEFEQLQQGDVLVIPYSDVSWTPLFSKAGAVIAESGGILSHSSIVAREYQIPAVVSVPEAIMRLKEGVVVTVDGYAGEIIAHAEGALSANMI